MWKSPNEKLQASENFWFSSISQLFNWENSRENAIRKAIISKGLCCFLFQSAPSHRNLQPNPLWSQTAFQNKHNRGLQVKSRILMSKTNFKTLWKRNYKRTRVSSTFHFFTLFYKIYSKRGRILKCSTFQETGLFFLVSSTPQKPTKTSSGITDGVP